MKLFRKAKDGGPESTVTGYWLIEAKKLFSIVLLKFEDGSRDAFHSHAFNSWNWLLKGSVVEQFLDGSTREWFPGWKPITTLRSTFHRVVSHGTTWVLSVRGPWSDHWQEYLPKTSELVDLTHGRRRVQLRSVP